MGIQSSSTPKSSGEDGECVPGTCIRNYNQRPVQAGQPQTCILGTLLLGWRWGGASTRQRFGASSGTNQSVVPVGFVLQGQNTGPCCPVHARDLPPTHWHDHKTRRKPPSFPSSLGRQEGGWERCCESPVTHTSSRLLAGAPRQPRLSLPMGVCRHRADPHER